jgi:hypothetical protein
LLEGLPLDVFEQVFRARIRLMHLTALLDLQGVAKRDFALS